MNKVNTITFDTRKDETKKRNKKKKKPNNNDDDDDVCPEVQEIWEDYCRKVNAVMMGNIVDITGLDRKVLLRKLWDHAEPTTAYMIKVLTDDSLPDTNEFYIDHIMKDESVVKRGYVDYAFGRLIKTYLFTDDNIIDVTEYDNAWGKGSFQRIVNEMKKTVK